MTGVCNSSFFSAPSGLVISHGIGIETSRPPFFKIPVATVQRPLKGAPDQKYLQRKRNMLQYREQQTTVFQGL